MASPKEVVFFLYNESTGAPLAGQTPTFSTYKDSTGANVAQPAISEVGGGAYKFTPVFPVDLGLVFIIDGGAGTIPRYQNGYLRPEDYLIDDVADIRAALFGRWKIHQTGPDANRIVFYAEDDVTVLQKFDLFDENGDPTAVGSILERFPV